MNRPPLVYAILLNWNGWKDTVACLETCRNVDYGNVRFLVVDNGSTDQSVQVLRRSFADVELVETGANLGFSGGNNFGIRHALRQGADYVWLLNNDTVVKPATLTPLVELAERDPRIGMVGSKILFHDDPRLLWYAGGVMDPEQPYLVRHRGYGEGDLGQFDDSGETGYVTGCSLLARREMIEEVGLLDDAFFLYFEDADWNARSRRRGWKGMYCGDSVVLHKASSSMGGSDSPRMRYYLARNLLYFIRKNFPSSLPAAFGFDLYENVLVQLKKGRFAAATGALRGIGDFMRGRTGPMVDIRRGQ